MQRKKCIVSFWDNRLKISVILIKLGNILKYKNTDTLLTSKMSEGPEVKMIADKIRNTLGNSITIQDMLCNKIDEETRNKIIGSHMEYVKTFGKNIVIKFTTGIYLRNHMMMWGKWRIYNREEYDKGLAKSPSTWRSLHWKKRETDSDSDTKELTAKRKNQMDVRDDSRVRLSIITADSVLIQFNGPILQFSVDDPAGNEPIKSLGPDGLSDDFNKDKVKSNLKNKSILNKNLLIADALLNQQLVCGIGNKYKSEILFLNKLHPFKKVDSLTEYELDKLVLGIPKILGYGYKNKGRTRSLSNGEKASWNTIHWVFRRSGKPCWTCSARISSEKKITTRSTFWCPLCQPSEL
jgi:formamidopyrimidine-DNA glycosylase